MTAQETIALIQVLIPTIVAVILFTYHQVVNRLPAKEQAYIARQQEALKHLVPHAVQAAEQISDPTTSGREKKLVAMGMIKSLLDAFDIAEPSDEVLSALIESTVYAVKQTKTPPPSAPTLIAPPQIT